MPPDLHFSGMTPLAEGCRLPLSPRSDDCIHQTTRMLHRYFIRFVRWLGYDLGISPNQITIGRLFCFIPGWLMWIFRHDLAARFSLPWQLFGWVAFSIVTVVIVFDIVDGALARETGQVSQQGKVLDPAVDKFITYSSLALFWDVIDHTPFMVLFLLDVTSTLLRGRQIQGANEFGKKKALSQNLSKIFFGMAALLGLAKFNVIGNVLIWLALSLAIISVFVRIVPSRAKHPFYILIPQILTLGNLGAGIAAIWCAAQGSITYGAMLLFAAMAFDLTDGAVARRLGVTSSFGKYFDTCADLVSFGIAPGCLAAAATGWPPISYVFAAIYAIATGIRLYDYGRSKDITPDGFFRGLPSPAAAWLVVSFTLCTNSPLIYLVLLAAAGLMCSFPVHWQHFSRMLPSLRVTEIIASMSLGLIPAATLHPLSFLTGPIIVYALSPLWRKPGDSPLVDDASATIDG